MAFFTTVEAASGFPVTLFGRVGAVGLAMSFFAAVEAALVLGLAVTVVTWRSRNEK